MTMMMVTSVCLAGGDISKKILFMMGEDGTVYYVKPLKMPKLSDSKALKNLVYDVTCLNSEDSVSFTATVITENVHKFTEATITTSGMAPVKAAIEVIYIDPKGKKYENRLRLRISRADFKAIYHSPAPYVVDYGFGLRFGLKEKTWPKDSHFMNEVFILVDSTT